MTGQETQEADSLDLLLKDLTPRLQALLWRYHVPEMDGQDLVQDAVLALLASRSRIENKPAWLLVAARNQCVSYQRRRNCWSRLVDSMDPERLRLLAPLVEAPQKATEIDHDIARVKRIWAELSESDRMLLALRFFHGLGPSAIASRIRCHPGSVRRATLRALARIKRALGI